MDVSAKNMQKLISFIDKIEKETYPEPPGDIHTEITRRMLDTMISEYHMPPDSRILDVGCGQGPALDYLMQRGYRAAGITLNDEDVRACRAKNHDVVKMDQSFLDYPDAGFDFVWARHVIEHSIFPYFTLSEFSRVLRPHGYLYLEVPAPETSCHHEENVNHYSVLGHEAWVSLLKRSGFDIIDEPVFSFQTGMGPDTYWGFICIKR